MDDARSDADARGIPSRYAHDFLDSMDGRRRITRELRTRLDALAADLGGDLSYQRLSLAKRAVHIEALMETLEQRLADGEDVPVTSYAQMLNSLIGVYRLLGIERRAKDVPSLREYLDRKATERET